MARDRAARTRRQFVCGGLTLLGLIQSSGCGGLPIPGQQPARVPRIGLLIGGPQADFLGGLRDLGYVDGQTIALEIRGAENRPERLTQIMAEFVSLGVDVIVAAGNAPIRAAKQATSTTPIVMLVSSDPVGDGLIASLARPGGNVTGLSSIAVATVGKRLELLKQIHPRLHRLSVLWNTTESSKTRELHELRGRAQGLGVALHSAGVTSPEDLDSGLATATTAGADALLVLADPLTNSHRARITDFAVRNRLPSMYEAQESVLAGGLASYGRNLPDLYRRAATYVDKILRGANPADLPVEQPTEFDLVINLKTAHALGLTIPQSVLQQATEVIQ